MIVWAGRSLLGLMRSSSWLFSLFFSDYVDGIMGCAITYLLWRHAYVLERYNYASFLYNVSLKAG